LLLTITSNKYMDYYIIISGILNCEFQFIDKIVCIYDIENLKINLQICK
jgi:hypothetical protein